MKKMIAICIVIPMLAALTGCFTIQSTDLMIDIQKNEIISPVILEEQNVAVTDFAVCLFQQSMKAGENTLISPLSILAALSMTANGADGETLSQMASMRRHLTILTTKISTFGLKKIQTEWSKTFWVKFQRRRLCIW